MVSAIDPRANANATRLLIYLFIFYNRTIFINIINQYRMNEITYCLGHHEYSRQSSLFNALFSTFERKNGTLIMT